MTRATDHDAGAQVDRCVSSTKTACVDISVAPSGLFRLRAGRAEKLVWVWRVGTVPEIANYTAENSL
jgi:hypothetical protein